MRRDAEARPGGLERFKQEDGSHIMNQTWLTVVTLAAVGVFGSGVIELLSTTRSKFAARKREEHFGTIREQGKVNHGIYGESASGGRHGLRLCENEKR
jgi:hypothetical protein